MKKEKTVSRRDAKIALFVGLVTLCGCGFDSRIVGAREIAAVRWMRAINAAEQAYFKANGQYSGSLEVLSQVEASLFLRDEPTRIHYTPALKLTDSGYEVTLYPSGFRSTPMRSFYSDETSQVRWSNGAQAGKNSRLLE